MLSNSWNEKRLEKKMVYKGKEFCNDRRSRANKAPQWDGQSYSDQAKCTNQGLVIERALLAAPELER